MPKTFVTYLLDRTGSMGRIKQETIDGFNTYLSALQQSDNADDFVFTLVQFYGRGADTIYQRVPVKEAEPLTEAVFQPRGRTPLIDAVCKTLKAVERTVDGGHSGAPDGPPPAEAPRIVVCVQSDGDDNSSVEYSWTELQQLIADKQELGWELIFIGAYIDADAEAERIGLPAGNAIAYSADDPAMRDTFESAAAKTTGFARRPRDAAADPRGEVQQDAARNPQPQPVAANKQKIPDDIAV
ncbi:MAG: hypothetical protein ACOC8P_03190 [Dichotomicrobium sp.]